MILDFVAARRARQNPKNRLYQQRSAQVRQLILTQALTENDEIRASTREQIIRLDPFGPIARHYIADVHESIRIARREATSKTIDEVSRRRAMKAVQAAQSELNRINAMRWNDLA